MAPSSEPAPGESPDRPAVPDDPALGTWVGRYLLVEVRGADATGIVYVGRDPELDRRVAIKVLRPEEGGGTGDERLRAEAQALARVSHPNVVAVYDVGRVGGRAFLAMELVDGIPLRAFLAQRSLDVRARLQLLVEIGRGLAAAHAVDVVHGDVRAEHVIVDDAGRPRLSDFGLAEAPPSAEGDQRAFAAMCWEIVVGAPPSVPPALPRRPLTLRHAARVLARALAEPPTAPWPSTAALVDALAAIARAPVRWIALPLAAAAAATALALAVAPNGGRGGGGDDEAAAAACAGVASRATALWSEARAATVRDGFARTDSPLADHAAAAVDGGMRRAGADWRAAAEAACRRDPAGFVAGAGAALCLERRHAQAEALAAALETADRAVVSRAASAVAGIGPAAECLDDRSRVASSRGATAVATVTAPPHRELARRLDAAKADLDLGRVDAARAAAETVARDAEAAGALGLRTEALAILGEVERRLGHLDEARRLFGDAVATGDRAGDDRARAQALIDLGHLAVYDRIDADRARDDLALARGAIARVGDPPPLVVYLEQTEAKLALLRREPSAAIKLLEHALIVVRQHDPSSLREASVHADRGAVYLALGRYDEALAAFEQGAAQVESAVGAESDHAGAAHTNLATALSMLGRTSEALAHAQRAVDILRVTDPNSRRVAQALGNVAAIQGAAGERVSPVPTGGNNTEAAAAVTPGGDAPRGANAGLPSRARR